MSIKGYLFDTESAAIAAIDALNTHYGIPVSDDAVTRTYTVHEHWGNAWAVRYVEGLEAVLGEPNDLPVIEE